MAPTAQHQAHDHTFEEVTESADASSSHLAFQDLSRVRLTVSVDLGAATMLVRDVLNLAPGSIVTLDKPAGDMTDIAANGFPLARGEVVVIGDALHVRVAEVIGMTETLDDAPTK